MVRMAAEHGTTDLVATPHANLRYRFEPERIAERIAQVQRRLAARCGCTRAVIFT
jgi:tyrosine-protein phosphatase YwqE